MGSTSSKQSRAPSSLRAKRVHSESSTIAADAAAVAEMSSKKQTRRVGPLKSFRTSVANAIRRPRVVTSNGEDHSRSSSTATESSSNTTPDQPVASLAPPRDKAPLPPPRPVARDDNDSSRQRQPKEDHPQAPLNRDYQIMPQVKLGYGVAGEVRQCIHRSTSTVRAIKTMDKSRIRREDRIRREIDFLRQVDHPNIINLHDVYETSSHVHLVTELCRGGELFDAIIQKATRSKNARDINSSATSVQTKLPLCFHERDAARIVHSILSAVAYLHSKDIIHRDIKPENILFLTPMSGAGADAEEQPTIKLIDFGLSVRHTASSRPLTSSVGTPYYMAPELLDGCYDRSCDLWSIGVITYIVLTGRPPFNGRSDEAIFKNVRLGRVRLEDRGLSNQAQDFIRRLLDVDPKRRWSADMALNHSWLSYWG